MSLGAKRLDWCSVGRLFDGLTQDESRTPAIKNPINVTTTTAGPDHAHTATGFVSTLALHGASQNEFFNFH
jgi:hypothetical protein